MLLTSFALAASFTVDIEADAPDARRGDGQCADARGHCTLRAALEEAGWSEDPDTVLLPAGTYALRTGLHVSTDVTLIGAGRGRSVVLGGGTGSVLTVDGVQPPVVAVSGLTVLVRGTCAAGCGLYLGEGDVFLADVEIAGGTAVGSAQADAVGGAIANLRGSLALANVYLHDNSAEADGGRAAGGAIYNAGALTLRDSRLERNRAHGADDAVGGAIYSVGDLEASDGAWQANEAVLAGGALFSAGGAVRLDGVRVGDNPSAATAGVHLTGLGSVSTAADGRAHVDIDGIDRRWYAGAPTR